MAMQINPNQFHRSPDTLPIPRISQRTGDWDWAYPEQEQLYRDYAKAYWDTKGGWKGAPGNEFAGYMTKTAKMAGQDPIADRHSYIDTQRAKSFKPGRFITNLAGAVVAAGFIAAAPTILGASTAAAASGGAATATSVTPSASALLAAPAKSAAGFSAVKIAGGAALPTTSALLSAPVGSAAGFSAVKTAGGAAAASSGGFISTAKTALKVARYASTASQAIGLIGGGAGKAQAYTSPKTPDPEMTQVATGQSPEVLEEERRRRAAMANETRRQSTVRAGSLAPRPTLASAGILG